MAAKGKAAKKITRTAGQANSPARMARQANRWRDSFNPLRSLVLARVVALLEAGERGELAEIQWLYRMVEKRYAVLRSLIARRRAALLKLDWDIKVVSELPQGATEVQAERQRVFLRSRYEVIGNLREAIKFLALAEFRGFAILQKHRNEAGLVSELHWLPQWNFCRDGSLGDFYWNEGALNTSVLALGEENRIPEDAETRGRGDAGTGLRREDFIIRTEDMPINEIATIAFVRSNLSQKDWDAFIELFGLPGCVVIMPPNVPSGKESEFEEAAQSVAESASGAVPNGADVKFPSSAVRGGGGAPFKEHLEAQEKDVVLAGTGGKLAMLTASTGLNDSQGKEHGDAFDELAQGEAKEISEVMQRQFDALELGNAFPGEPRLAYFELAAQDQEDVDAVVARVVSLQGVGFETDVEEVSEKVGLKLKWRMKNSELGMGEGTTEAQRRGEQQGREEKTTEGEEDSTTEHAEDAKGEPEEDGKVRNRAALTERVAAAVAADLAPVRERLERILSIEDPEILRAKLSAFREEIERLKRDVGADPRLAGEIERLMATGFRNGLGILKTEKLASDI